MNTQDALLVMLAAPLATACSFSDFQYARSRGDWFFAVIFATFGLSFLALSLTALFSLIL